MQEAHIVRRAQRHCADSTTLLYYIDNICQWLFIGLKGKELGGAEIGAGDPLRPRGIRRLARGSPR